MGDKSIEKGTDNVGMANENFKEIVRFTKKKKLFPGSL